MSGTERQCLLCGDDIGIDDLDVHVNRAHRMMPDRYHEVAALLVAESRRAEQAEQRAAGLAVLVGRYREVLIEDVKYDDGTFMQTYRKCRWCWWSDNADYGESEHQPDCPYLWASDDRAREIGEAVYDLAAVADDARRLRGADPQRAAAAYHRYRTALAGADGARGEVAG